MYLPQGRLPVIPLKNTVLYPGLTQVIKVGRDKSVKALHEAEKNGFWIVASHQKQKENEALDAPAEPQDIHQIATLCRVESMKGKDGSGYQVVLRGMARVDLQDIINHPDRGYLEASSTNLDDIDDLNDATRAALLDSLKTLSKEILRLMPGNTEQLSELVESVDDLPYLTSLCAGNIEMEVEHKQKILSTRHLRERVLFLLQIMQEFKESLSIQVDIRNRMSQKLGQAQRQVILREQLKAIREELGEGTDANQEDQLKDRLDKAELPEEVRKIADQEQRRLNEVGNQSPESHIIRNYLDLLASLPWNKSAQDSDIDLDQARTILEGDHYGLEKVKKRIIQHLAVMKLKKSMKGSILLFVGPPGVGKTSLGQSIAKALRRKFVRVSVGGVRDDAEVRGHRRTYIGAMPGRIIQGIKRAGENNPVFLLDEIDKLGRGYSGDPAAALLEVLDPEQNNHFLDHYLDVGFDLSKVFFIATANSLEGIPGPLLDRMEVIDLSGYTTAEKIHIAKNHLIPKQMEEHGLTNSQVAISDEVLLRLISSHTREAGVRDLQRKIANLLRGMSEKIVAAPDVLTKVDIKDMEEIMGPERFQHEIAETLNPPGVVTGLAWTPVGGDILFIESTAMPGSGKLLITGQLGDVMKESAQIALSLIRSNLHDLGVQVDLKRTDFHVHVPAGAIPKDGPSAGVTLLTSLASLVTGTKVNPKFAMTGEISLRGAVMPVGGIKEKVIAAHRAGITEVILPKKNEKDYKDVPQEVKDQLKVHFVENAEELLKASLGIDLTNREWINHSLRWSSPPPRKAGGLSPN